MRHSAILLIVMILTGLMVSACSKGTQELDIDAQKTYFAQTADAQASMTIAAQPSATATIEATPTPTLTATLEEGAATPTHTETTVNEVTATSNNAVDEAQYRGQVPDDNTEYESGEVFTVTWTLENTGTSTWTTNYYILFTSGAQMDAEEKVYLPYPVTPNTNVQISVDFIAPGDAGEYQSVWSLVNANDVVFYTNFYIVINVVDN